MPEPTAPTAPPPPVAAKPRVLFVGGSRYRMPLAGSERRKWSALRKRLETDVVAAAAPGSPASGDGFHLVSAMRPAVVGRVLLPLRLGALLARRLRAWRPDVVVAESPHYGALALAVRALARAGAPRVVVEVHGDWRTATRLYGSRARALLGPIADGAARLALRRADGIRGITAYTTELIRRAAGRTPTRVFYAFSDLSAFEARPLAPLPAEPVALFVGVLERYKNIAVLLDAWPRVARRAPGARLMLVGDGAHAEAVERLVAADPSVSWSRRLDAPGVAAAMDAATLLVLPSASEGLGRVILEAQARARPTVGSRVGGIPEIVADGGDGLLVPPGDAGALADALVAVLVDRGLADRLSEGARRSYLARRRSDDDYARDVEDLVRATLGAPSPP